MSTFKEFCNKYPDYCNEELYSLLKGNKSQRKQSSKITIKEANEKIGNWVVVEGVVANLSTRDFSKKDGSGKGTLLMFNLYDKTGSIRCIITQNGNVKLANGDIVRVEGKVKQWKNNTEISVARLEVLGNINVSSEDMNDLSTPPEPTRKEERVEQASQQNTIEEILSLIASLTAEGKKVYYDRLEGYAKRIGVNMKDLEPYIVVREEQLPGSLEKIKYVELKKK